MKHQHGQNFCLPCALLEITAQLPHQGPIKDFIHQNTLEVFLDQPFDQAIVRGSEIFSAKTYMDLSFYRAKFAASHISEHALDQAVKAVSIDDNEQPLIRHALHTMIEIIDRKTFDFLVKRFDSALVNDALLRATCAMNFSRKPSLRKLIEQQLRCDLGHEVNAILFRLLGSYLDQGVSLWPYLENSDNFLHAILQLANHSAFPIARFVDNEALRNLLTLPKHVAILQILNEILASETLYADYLKESLFDHPGWSGMINVVEHHPESLAKRRVITIEELVVVKLAFEWQFIKKANKNFRPISVDDQALQNANDVSDSRALSLAYFLLTSEKTLASKSYEQLKNFSIITLQKIWHDALEKTYYEDIAAQFKTDIANENKRIKFQAVFCIDDRECSFRRHLESTSSTIETFSYAGFFGIDCYFKSHKKDLLDKMCPAPIKPKHVVMEIADKHVRRNEKLLQLASFISTHGANSMLFGFISAYTLGHLSLFRLIFGFFHPLKITFLKREHSREKTQLIFERRDDQKPHKGLHVGYTREEMADRVFSVLRNIGLYKDFAPVIFFIAHGSSSVNNPHFAAYDCGACSGRPGSINARIFAAMANMSSVRDLVEKKGITIPRDTKFIGGFHDTCTDDVTFFDLENLSEEQRIFVDEFLEYLKRARGKNAQERCEKFALVSSQINENEALAEVHHRARALFEPRPELGHATNALCIVGRRQRSITKNFHRRAFLQSYDPTIDPHGQILAQLMSAVIPVCAGINLEYFFSRIDPAIYGCGTKLSHNVVSLIGVGNGLDDDLRTGLPIQMTEIHDPVRLLIIIEQTKEIIARAVLENPALKPWVINDWIKLAMLDPHSNNLVFLKAIDNQFLEVVA